MEKGPYESLLTERLHRVVEGAPAHGLHTLLAKVDEADQPYVLAMHIADAAERAAEDDQCDNNTDDTRDDRVGTDLADQSAPRLCTVPNRRTIRLRVPGYAAALPAPPPSRPTHN